MTLTAPARLNDVQLADVVRRINSPMNDDGLRTWYRLDGNALLEEVIALRRERAAAMQGFAANPPLEGIDQATDLREVAARLTGLWQQQREGVWQKAEVKRIREKLALVTQEHKVADELAGQRAVRITQLETELGFLKDTLLKTQQQLSDVTLSAQQRINGLERERDQAVTELGETKLAANRAIVATQKAYADRAARARQRLEEVSSALGSDK